MKKLLFFGLIFLLSIFLCSCGDAGQPLQNENEALEEQTEAAKIYELALIADAPADSSGAYDPYTEAACSGLKRYGEENDISYTYYVPADVSDQSYVDAIGQAVSAGAKMIVLPGSLFEAAAYDAQYRFPEVHFLLLDGQPRTADYKTYAIEKNVDSIYFSQGEQGFLAGYFAVKEGYTHLGFIGGMALSPVVRLGYGFISGAKYAAAEDNVTVEIRYSYSGSFSASDTVQTIAGSMYNAGVEVILSGGRDITESITAAAEPVGTYVIGVDVDQANISSAVITSSVKELAHAVYSGIADFYNGEFHNGSVDTLGMEQSGLSLVMGQSFNKFTTDLYSAVSAKLITGAITIPSDTAYSDPTALADERVSVAVVK